MREVRTICNVITNLTQFQSNTAFCFPVWHHTWERTVQCFNFHTQLFLLHQSNSDLLIVCIDYLGVSWLYSSPRVQGNVRLIPASSVAAGQVTTWLVDDEVSPTRNNALFQPCCQWGLYAGSLCSGTCLVSSSCYPCLRLRFRHLPPHVVVLSGSHSSLCSSFQWNTEYSEMEPLTNCRLVYKFMAFNRGVLLEYLRHQNAELAVFY